MLKRRRRPQTRQPIGEARLRQILSDVEERERESRRWDDITEDPWLMDRDEREKGQKR